MYRISPYLLPKRPRFKPWKKNYSWTVVWCCVTVLVKYWHWRSYLVMCLWNWHKAWFWVVNTFVMCFMEKCHLLCIGEMRVYITLLVVHWLSYRFVIAGGVCLGKAMKLNSAGKSPQKCHREKQEWSLHNVKPNNRST